MKIYTKTGDKGTTALYGGERVSKDARRVSAYGTVDEANAALGLARAHLSKDSPGDNSLSDELAKLQNALFDLGADLASPHGSRYRENIVAIDESDVAHLERLIDTLEGELAPLQNFILPGGHPAAAALHVARGVTRRAERKVVELMHEAEVNAHVGVYLNRLSDLLFVMSRVVNAREGVAESEWHVKGRERPETSPS